MSCDEIEQVFVDYNDYRETAGKTSSLLGADDKTANAMEEADKAYDKAATVARPILAVKGCALEI